MHKRPEGHESKTNNNKKDTKTITSGDIFSARTLETRFVLNHYDQRTAKPNHVISVHRNLLRRGRSPFPKKHNHKYSKRNKTKMKIETKKSRKLLRYQKRKPFYLQQEKTKNPNCGWLNTHLWHAKRCKMQNLWRYKLSMRNLQHASKSFRSTITQLTTCCTLHDASYWNIIALQGKQSDIMQLLSPFIAPFQRGSDLFTNKEALGGYKECELYIYRKDCYPFGFLCAVQCCWNAIEINEAQHLHNAQRVCWLWCHASVYHALFQLLQQIVKESEVKIRNESRKFVRYELRGPMSSFVLQAASNCAVPVLVEGNSEKYVADGTILSAKMICDPTHYSVSQPFVWNKKIKNELQFQLKDEFISLHSPPQHPVILLHQYKANNHRLNGSFHSYFDEKELMEVDDKKKRKKSRNALYEFPFMMIAKRFYDVNQEKNMALRNKISGWDIIIPIHSNILKPFKIKQAPLKFTSIARFWWNNLYFCGARVIGYEQKRVMRIEFDAKQALFPMDYIDCSASVHFWLKYHKYEILKTYFKKPKSKRINPYPLYPFGFWPNALSLFQNKDIMKDSELSENLIKNNLIKIQQYEKEKESADKELQYLLNYTVFGLKADSTLMNHIHLNLKCDVIQSFDVNWNQNADCKYFIVRDKKILSRRDLLCDWNESIMNAALVLVKVTMSQKGVPSCGNPMFLNNSLFGYVIDGQYSSVKGRGTGIGLVLFNKLLSRTQDDDISVCPFSNHQEQRHLCDIEVITN